MNRNGDSFHEGRRGKQTRKPRHVPKGADRDKSRDAKSFARLGPVYLPGMAAREQATPKNI